MDTVVVDHTGVFNVLVVSLSLFHLVKSLFLLHCCVIWTPRHHLVFLFGILMTFL